MFGWILKNFIKKNKLDLTDQNGNIIKKSSITFNKNNERFLKLNDDSCAIVLYPDNNVEVIFTKAYNLENQKITENEEFLMALALFMKQPGFPEMMVGEFRKIAMNKISTLIDEGKK